MLGLNFEIAVNADKRSLNSTKTNDLIVNSPQSRLTRLRHQALARLLGNCPNKSPRGKIPRGLMKKSGPRNRGSHPLRAATHYKRPLRLLRLPETTFVQSVALVNSFEHFTCSIVPLIGLLPQIKQNTFGRYALSEIEKRTLTIVTRTT